MNQNTFINATTIENLLTRHINSSPQKIDDILAKALELKGLDIEDAATLITISDKDQLEKIFQTALKIKDEIYGNRLVLFAPLYVSNHCANNCLYCGFRHDNKDMKRICLNIDEVKDETRIILEEGHKRILMLMGEHPAKCSFEYFLETIDAAYAVKDSKGSSLRRVNIEIAPLSDVQFAELSHIPIGTYTCFQETYHEETYKKMHPSGKKSHYDWRLNVMDRALKNGLHDVGIGALFGLYDYRFEVLALLQHAKHLDETYRIGPHTISVPRIESAQNAPASRIVPHPTADTDFKKIVAVLRCAVPYTGIILSTRESPTMRNELFHLGISQISAGSRTSPGGYANAMINSTVQEQFSVNDTRSTGEVIRSVIEQGFVPSFCTGCYRRGRTGQDFMELAKPGLIKAHCLPNALLTLKEYLKDYADEETRIWGENIIKKELLHIPSKNRMKKTEEYLKQVENGKRDLYF